MAIQKAEFLTYEEAAKELRCSSRSVKRLVSRGVFGRHRSGYYVLIPADEVAAYNQGALKGDPELAVRNYRIQQGRIKR